MVAKDNLPKTTVEDELLPAIPDKTGERKIAASKLGDMIRKGGNVLGGIKEKLPDAPTKEDIGVAAEIINRVLRETGSSTADNAEKTARYLSDQFEAVGIQLTAKDAMKIVTAFRTGGVPLAVGFLLKNYGTKIVHLSYRIGKDVNEARKNRSKNFNAESGGKEDDETSDESIIYKTARDLAKNPEVRKAAQPIIDEAKKRALEEISRRLNKKK